MAFKIGDQVSLKADPSRQGLIVGGPRVTGSIIRWQIHFLDGERNRM